MIQNIYISLKKKNLYKSTIKRQKNLMEKGAKNLNKNFTKEDIQVANNKEQKDKREMQFTTTMRCHFIPTKIHKFF